MVHSLLCTCEPSRPTTNDCQVIVECSIYNLCMPSACVVQTSVCAVHVSYKEAQTQQPPIKHIIIPLSRALMGATVLVLRLQQIHPPVCDQQLSIKHCKRTYIFSFFGGESWLNKRE